MALTDTIKPGAHSLFIMALLLFSFLLIGSIFGYQRERSVIQKMARTEARIVAGEVLETMGEVNFPPPGATGKEAVVHRQAEELQQLVNRITAPDRFRVELLPFDPEKKGVRVDGNELKLLRRLETGKSEEEFLFLSLKGERGLLYMRPVRAGKECLGCHGSFASAPGPLRSLFPPGSGIYGHRENDMMGAVSVFVPMRELYEEVTRNVLSTLLIMIAPIILLFIFAFFGWRKLGR